MKWRLFFQRDSKFSSKLLRLHHTNGILFFILMITGFLLISSFFYTAFPTIRYQLKIFHIWIGLLSIVPLLFYLPKMKDHIKLKQGKGTFNLYFIIGILAILTLSGLVLTFQKQFPPMIRSVALAMHDITFWIGIPYIVYHALTRSRSFRAMEKRRKRVEIINQEDTYLEDYNPVYNRKVFLRVLSGFIITIAFSPMIIKGLKPYFSKMEEVTKAVEGHYFAKLPSTTFAKPKGEGMQGSFRYYTITKKPKLTKENWSLTIDGLVDNKIKYNWNQFMNLQRDVHVSDFHCVTGWSVYNITLEGIPLKRFLQEAGVNKEAKYVKFYSADEVYTDCLTLDEALLDDIMVAVSIDGELISHDNGGPVRLMVPQMLAYKSVKWLNRIEIIEDEHLGYWVEAGYEQHPWVKES